MILTLALLAIAQQTPTIQEWNVPWAASRPRDPYLDRAGKVWFVGQVGHYVAVLDPGTGSSRSSISRPARGPTT